MKRGKYSNGRKVTGIEFINNNVILVSTNDSRIRLLNIYDGKTIQKFKGHTNEKSLLKAFYDDTYNLVISTSDDNRVYIWDKKPNVLKTNSNCEYIKPFRSPHRVQISMFVDEVNYTIFTKKLLAMTKSIFLKNMIVNVTNTGVIQILINLIT
jgi:WD40 repeat protein